MSLNHLKHARRRGTVVSAASFSRSSLLVLSGFSLAHPEVVISEAVRPVRRVEQRLAVSDSSACRSFRELLSTVPRFTGHVQGSLTRLRVDTQRSWPPEGLGLSGAQDGGPGRLE